MSDKLRTENLEDLFDTLENHGFSNQHCFLCGQELADDNRSDEHVFPKWMQRKFNLWDKTLVLLNGSTIPYRKLTTPCCASCNTKHLSALEKRIEKGLIRSAKNVQAPSQLDLFYWLNKFLIGLLYRLLHMAYDQRDPSKGSIVERRMMDRIRMAHLFLQGVRLEMRISCPYTEVPASIFVFDLQEPETPDARFDYQDDITTGSFFFRLGTRGVLGTFDGGAQQDALGDFIDQFKKYNLHPHQFEEMGAKFFYKAQLMSRTPKYVIIGNSNQYDIQMLPLEGLSGGPIFDNWDHKYYAQWLQRFTHAPIQILQPDSSSDLVASWLWDDDGNFVEMKLQKDTWRGQH